MNYIITRGGMTKMETIAETDRPVLRRYRKEELQNLYEYLSDETVVRFEPYQPTDMNEAIRSGKTRMDTAF